MKLSIDRPTTVSESAAYEEVTITPGGSLAAPEGKFVTLTVNGIGVDPVPGTYTGDVRITVSDAFVKEGRRFGKSVVSSFRSAICVEDGRLRTGNAVPALAQGGTVTDSEANDVTIESHQWDYNGFYITGDSKYTINRAAIRLYGDGTDDFSGLGAGIAAAGNAEVTVNDSTVYTEGTTRGTAFIGGHATLTMNDCELSTVSGTPTREELAKGREQHRMMEPPWAIRLRGHGRTTNLAGFGTFVLNRCHAVSNSWGVLSVDGAVVNRMVVRDCLIELNGVNGYGLFSICDDTDFDYGAYGDYGCLDVVDHSVIRVPTFGIVMSLGSSAGLFTNGSCVRSEHFGAHIFRNNGGKLRIEKKSEFHTGDACITVKGSNTTIELDDAVMDSKNGVILQLMDNDDPGMSAAAFRIPVGKTDTPSGKDLFAAAPDEDVFVSVSNMTAVGDFLNSTTDLHANCLGQENDPEPVRGMGWSLQGAKNLDLTLTNATIRGRISSATQAYREGLTEIVKETCEELLSITQTPAPPVNNGVILHLDADSTWVITDLCYLTGLDMAPGARLITEDGSVPVMTVDGVPTQPGTTRLRGIIVLHP